MIRSPFPSSFTGLIRESWVLPAGGGAASPTVSPSPNMKAGDASAMQRLQMHVAAHGVASIPEEMMQAAAGLSSTPAPLEMQSARAMKSSSRKSFETAKVWCLRLQFANGYRSQPANKCHRCPIFCVLGHAKVARFRRLSMPTVSSRGKQAAGSNSSVLRADGKICRGRLCHPAPPHLPLLQVFGQGGGEGVSR